MKLGRYEVVRELGKGAMGVVYLAKDPLIGRLVALKTIRASAHSDDDEAQEFQQRFVREAQAAGILNHPAIVTVHDIGQDDATGVSFIAMEYVEGQNLKEILAQGRALSFDQLNDVIVQVADALDFAHAKGIVHRDVKPANIILVEGNRAKITDFGIAKIASSNANLTTTGQFLGTPNYMAPEQIKGMPVDGRSDLFSLGICLYECLTRRKPFGGDSLTTISYKIVHEPFPPLREINPQIPEGYEEVVARCLAKDPARRYQRGRDFAAALRAVARGERPVQNDPVLADETMVTRHLDRGPAVPTIEVPFPEAQTHHEAQRSVVTQAAKVPAPEAKHVAAAAAVDEQATTTPRRRPVDRLKTTLTNVRTAPLWKRHVHPAIFFAIVALLVMCLGGVLAAIQRGNATVPPVDRAAEMRRARERQLRVDGNQLIQQRRFAEAHAKYIELAKMAPKSPAVIMTLQRLEAVRQQEQLTTQQAAAAAAKLQQGITLYNEKKFAEAIPVLQEAFTLNPSSNDAANYLKLAQQESQRVIVAATTPAKTPAKPREKVPVKTAVVKPDVVAASGPARLTTAFKSPFKDGYIMVKVGADVVAHENLFEQGKGIFKRRSGRAINVSKEFPAKNADVEVWVVVPSLSVQEHRSIRQSFAPGSSYTLTVSYDANSKAFDYRLE